MKNTIEQALQRQKEQEKKALAEKQKSEGAPPRTSLERAQDVSNKTKAEKTSAEAQPKVEITTAPNVVLSEQTEANIASKPDANAARAVKQPAVKESKPKGKKDKTLTIDLERLERLGFVSLESARNLINEEYREIKRKLLQNAFGPLASTITNSNIIMVSSARPSEGKTFTATNLAISIAAEQDKTVLLVDADVLKPNVLRTLDLDEDIGLMEYLLGDVKDLGDVIYHTNVPKLKIIPAGQTHHLSTELLASTMMRETVEEFSNRYPDRVVIIDTPPLIGINESAILANLAGQAVIVAEEGRSRMNDIQTAVERLNPEMAIGFVLNKSKQPAEKYGYYGYHYYGNEY